MGDSVIRSHIFSVEIFFCVIQTDPNFLRITRSHRDRLTSDGNELIIKVGDVVLTEVKESVAKAGEQKEISDEMPLKNEYSDE